MSESSRNNHIAAVSKVIVDSIYITQYDSVFIRQTADTVFLEKYHIRTDYRLKIDTICIRDSVYIGRDVVQVKEVNRLSFLQNIQVWCGRVLLFAGVLIVVFLFFKNRLKLW
jgi:hypothetical protein